MDIQAGRKKSLLQVAAQIPSKRSACSTCALPVQSYRSMLSAAVHLFLFGGAKVTWPLAPPLSPVFNSLELCGTCNRRTRLRMSRVELNCEGLTLPRVVHHMYTMHLAAFSHTQKGFSRVSWMCVCRTDPPMYIRPYHARTVSLASSAWAAGPGFLAERLGL